MIVRDDSFGTATDYDIRQTCGDLITKKVNETKLTESVGPGRARARLARDRRARMVSYIVMSIELV